MIQFMRAQRILSALIATGYLVGAFVSWGSEAGLRLSIALLLPISCIWFSEELGDYTGNWDGHLIDEKSPGWMVAFAGWALLVLPPLAILLLHLTTKR